MLTNEQETKLKALFDVGLCSGIGTKEQTCIEGALCLVLYGALDDNHRGAADCRGEGIVRASIRLNDGRWSSDEARAKGLWDLALAQIDSAKLGQRFIAKRYAELTIRQVLPIALRRAGLEEAALRCERDGDESAARAARKSAADTAAAAATAAYTAADTAAAATAAATAYAYAYAYAYAAAAAATTAADTAAYAYADAYAAAYAAAAATADSILSLSAILLVQAINEARAKAA